MYPTPDFFTDPEMQSLPPVINIHGHLYDFSTPWVMGILNVTPDSFYAGSRTQGEEEIEERILRIRREGADCIDIGGYSTRPGADEVSPQEEWRRISGALRILRRVWPEAIVSVDTFRAEVARKAVEEFGVEIINDISGGTLDPEMFATVAELKVAYVLMHTRGTPDTMQQLTDYRDVMAEVISDLAFKAAELRRLGVCDIIIDPGFGFAKTAEQNYRLLDDLRQFTYMGFPVLAGMSRKSMIWRPLGITPEESLPGTVALHTAALLNGASIVRVHDVAAARQMADVCALMLKAQRPASELRIFSGFKS